VLTLGRYSERNNILASEEFLRSTDTEIHEIDRGVLLQGKRLQTGISTRHSD
jgi:hypothetical protein